MTQKQDISSQLLIDYLAGESTPEQIAQVERWLAESADNRRQLSELRSAWEQLSSRPVDPQTAEALTDVSHALAAHVSNVEKSRVRLVEPQRVSTTTWSNGWSRWIGYAAAACLLVAASWWGISSNGKTPQSGTYTTYVTRAGQRASLKLVDGSQVTIGPATTLRVNRAASTDGAISVEVTGEALFNVNHAAQRPFIVTAHGVTARVLGTEFVVRAYDASHIRVAVREGRVSVQSPVFTSASAAIVAAGEAASVTPNALPSVIPIADLATDFAWADGELVLRDVPLGEALLRLSRWYAMDFQVTDSSLLTSRVTSNFLTTYSDTEIKALARVIGARVIRSGNTLTFSAAQ